ncbi:zinc knuckle CX2CX4HX4C containing protein [Tanacetum coccineum]|uniref:Zinc knuckle CX2CX4HX4C containing protein n=1 Tax=Tanacetum coccineum TaxID=301880 RepID=A0ABQ4XMC2_9ASTR
MIVRRYFVGYRMTINELRYNLRKVWSRYGFNDIIDTINEPAKIPLWIEICNLPFEIWTTKGISDLDSGVEKPMVMDDVTAIMCKNKVGKVRYARVLVEVSAQMPLPANIEIVYNNGLNKPNKKDVNDGKGKSEGMESQKKGVDKINVEKQNGKKQASLKKVWSVHEEILSAMRRDPTDAEMLKWNIDVVAYNKQRKGELVNNGKATSDRLSSAMGRVGFSGEEGGGGAGFCGLELGFGCEGVGWVAGAVGLAGGVRLALVQPSAGSGWGGRAGWGGEVRGDKEVGVAWRAWGGWGVWGETELSGGCSLGRGVIGCEWGGMGRSAVGCWLAVGGGVGFLLGMEVLVMSGGCMGGGRRAEGGRGGGK